MTRITADKIIPGANYLAELLNELNEACAHEGLTLKVTNYHWKHGDEHKRFEVTILREHEPEVTFTSKKPEKAKG